MDVNTRSRTQMTAGNPEKHGYVLLSGSLLCNLLKISQTWFGCVAWRSFRRASHQPRGSHQQFRASRSRQCSSPNQVPSGAGSSSTFLQSQCNEASRKIPSSSSSNIREQAEQARVAGELQRHPREGDRKALRTGAGTIWVRVPINRTVLKPCFYFGETVRYGAMSVSQSVAKVLYCEDQD